MFHSDTIPAASTSASTKNVYGREESGVIWFQMLSQFLTDEIGFSVMPVDRCLFRMSREIDGVTKTCVVLTYVDDLLVVGDSELQAEVSSAIAARFPVTKGGSDYLGMRITQRRKAYLK